MREREREREREAQQKEMKGATKKREPRRNRQNQTLIGRRSRKEPQGQIALGYAVQEQMLEKREVRRILRRGKSLSRRRSDHSESDEDDEVGVV